MEARVAPTSPAHKKSSAAVEAVWREGQIQQPMRLPWWRVVVMIVGLSFVLCVLTLMGAAWVVHRYPHSVVARFIPFTTTTTTTVVQPVKDSTKSAVPEAVQKFADTAFGVVRNQGKTGIYVTGDATGYAWPLSSSGWLLSLNGAWSSDMTSLDVVPGVGAPQVISSTLTDPASPYVFLKTTDIQVQPVSFAPSDSRQPGVAVWVVGRGFIFSRQLGAQRGERWAASDRVEEYLTLDTPVTAAIGSAVVDVQGRVIGLLGSEGKVWSASAIDAVLRTVIQSGTVSRASLGVRSMNLAEASVTGDPSARGYRIGAGEGQAAVTVKGPADKAGVKSGDTIISFDGTEVTGDLFLALQKYHPGDVIKVVLDREGKQRTVNVTLVALGS